MHTLPKNLYALAICLSALAGCVDAIGFLHLGGYFVSFMSGNSTRLAVNFIAGNMEGIALVGSVIACFVSGAMLGVIVRHFSPPALASVSVLGAVTALLAGAATFHEMGWHMTAVALMALAMGAENAVFQRGSDVVVGLTYMTGSLVKMGQRLATSLLGGEKYTWVPYFLLWLGLITGGCTGALLFKYFGLHSLWFVVAFAGALTLASLRLRHHLAS